MKATTTFLLPSDGLPVEVTKAVEAREKAFWLFYDLCGKFHHQCDTSGKAYGYPEEAFALIDQAAEAIAEIRKPLVSKAEANPTRKAKRAAGKAGGV